MPLYKHHRLSCKKLLCTSYVPVNAQCIFTVARHRLPRFLYVIFAPPTRAEIEKTATKDKDNVDDAPQPRYSTAEAIILDDADNAREPAGDKAYNDPPNAPKENPTKESQTEKRKQMPCAHGLDRNCRPSHLPESQLCHFLSNEKKGLLTKCGAFSLWTASLEVAFWRVPKNGSRGMNIAVLDTTKVDNEIFHMQQLWRAGLVKEYDGMLTPAWYVCHGMPQGRGVLVVPLEELGTHYVNALSRQALSLEQRRTSRLQSPWHGICEQSTLVTHVEAAARAALRVTRPMHVRFATTKKREDHPWDDTFVSIAAAFLGLRFARYAPWNTEQLDLIFDTIKKAKGGSFSFSPRFSGEVWLEDGLVYKLAFPDIDRSFRLVRHIRTRDAVLQEEEREARRKAAEAARVQRELEGSLVIVVPRSARERMEREAAAAQSGTKRRYGCWKRCASSNSRILILTQAGGTTRIDFGAHTAKAREIRVMRILSIEVG